MCKQICWDKPWHRASVHLEANAANVSMFESAGEASLPDEMIHESFVKSIEAIQAVE